MPIAFLALGVHGSRVEVREVRSNISNPIDALWEFELSGSWDIPASIQDDRISTVSDRLSEDEMFKIYKLQVKTEFVPHFTTDLQTNLEAIPDPVERTRPKAMILSNGQEYMDLGLEGDGWFHHAGILKPSVLTVATEGKSFRELLTKVLQRAMRSVKKKVGPDWTTVVEDGVFHIGAHYKGGAKDTLPQNHYHLMSPAPITEDQVKQIRDILQAWHLGPGKMPKKS